MLRVASLIVMTAMLVGESGRAYAAPSDTSGARPRPARVRDALKGEALAAFDRGSALFNEGDVAGARAEFMRAYTLAQEPRILYNVAVCDKGERRYARALKELRESLSIGGASLPTRYVQTVEDTIAVLRPLVSTLTLKVDEDGASVSLDDEPVGTTPLVEPLAVEVGEHVIDVRKAGFHDVRERFEASSGAPSAITLQLDPVLKLGQLTVRARGLPAGSAGVAVVDGAEMGPLPWTGSVVAGVHSVSARAPGFAGSTMGVAVPYRGSPEAFIDMKPERHEGRLRVSTGDADIYLDGKLAGHGEFEGRVTPGEHSIRLMRSGSLANRTDVVVRDGETRSVSIQLAGAFEVPVWLWIAGGVAVAGGATAAILLLTQKTHYEGSSVGTLPPGVVPATVRFGGF